MPRRRVVLVPFDPAWPELAAREAALIAGVLRDRLVAIHHIGSTAIPGIQAKPVIDLVGVVHAIGRLDADPELLCPLGYAARGESGVPGRRYFTKPATGPRTHHVHFFQTGDPNIARHLLFRDYLIAHPGVAAEYERLKEALAARYPEDTAAYTDGKHAFIQATEAAAARWRGPASA